MFQLQKKKDKKLGFQQVSGTSKEEKEEAKE